MKNLNNFKKVWVLDSEFYGGNGDPQIPVCIVAKNILTSETKKIWIEEGFESRLYPISSDNLYVAYYSSAEWGTHLSLDLPIPLFILDLYTEFKCLTNGLRIPHGASLLGACMYYGVPSSDTAYKDQMRERILQGPPYSDKEKKAILDYCEKDVLMTEQLFYKMKSQIDFTYALLRGRYMGCVAQMEHNGVPVDVEAFQELKQCFPIIKEELVWRIDKDFGVFDKTTFKEELFRQYLKNNDIPWDLTPEGHLQLDEDYFKEKAMAYPQLTPLKDLRYSLSQLKLNDLQIGNDGRNRCLLSPFRSKTGRNQPSSSKYIFGPAVWLRNLIKPVEGNALAYIDYSQQELAIAAQLSQDKNLLQAYASGDPYLTFAKSIGAIPPDGTKETHKETRELFKRLFLATNYGMSVETFAKQAGIPLVKAKSLLAAHKRQFNGYWEWATKQAGWATLTGRLQTMCHWNYYTTDAKERSLLNWPMQAHGADILRIAIILCFQNGIKIVGPVHDAILIEAPINEIEQKVAIAQKLMEQASEMVIGFKIRTDAKIIKFPDRYSDPRGTFMWNTVWDILKNLGPQEKQQRLFDLQNQESLLNYFNEKPKEKLSRYKLDLNEKNLLTRLRKKSHLTILELTYLIKLARNTDYDLEERIDWKYSGYQDAKKQILADTQLKIPLKKLAGEET